MITLTGNGRLTRDLQLRTTHSGKTVATISVASDRRDRDAQPVYLDLVVWEAPGHRRRRAPRQGPGRQLRRPLRAARVRHQAGEQRVALELHGVDLEYGAKPRSTAEPTPAERRGGRHARRRGRHPLLTTRGRGSPTERSARIGRSRAAAGHSVRCDG